jgi:arylsulfatase A-like enzyme
MSVVAVPKRSNEMNFVPGSVSMLSAIAAGLLASAAPINVMFIVADDMGWGDLSCFGGDIKTPHLDQMAAQGAKLTSFYTTASVCTPSRYSMMTGKMPWKSAGGLGGVQMILDNRHNVNGFAEEETTIGELMQAGGYRTGLVGKWHLGHGSPADFPTRHGFDSFYGASGGCIDYFQHRYGFRHDWFRGEKAISEDGYATRLVTKGAVDFLRQESDMPFFLFVSHFAPHYGKSIHEAEPGSATLQTGEAGNHKDPVDGKTKHLRNTLQAPESTVDEFKDEADLKRRYFKAMVRELDDSIGEIMAEVPENTLVLFFADNGPDETISSAGDSGVLAGAKHGLNEGGIRVPAIAWWPGEIERGITVDQVLSTLDLYPTLAAMTGQKADGLDGGLDLRPLIDSESDRQRTLVWRRGNTQVIRRGDWKLMGNRLYNVASDPGEKLNRAENLPGLVASLKVERARTLAR